MTEIIDSAVSLIDTFLATQTSRKDKSIQLSLFDLPPNLLTSKAQEFGEKTSLGNTYHDSSVVADFSKGMTCRTCGLSFNSLLEQQDHFKQASHVVNLRRKLNNQPPILAPNVSETVISEPLAIENNSSESESNEDSDTEYQCAYEDEEISQEYSENLMKELEYDKPWGTASRRITRLYGPVYLYKPVDSTWSYKICTAALHPDRDPWEGIFDLCRLSNQIWTVLILRSGRFAGAVFEGKNAIEHKTMRRYTIRAKRGGSQSSYDTAGRRPKSIGAQLRRYGEQALKEDVRALLQSWKIFLNESNSIIISVPKTMRSILFEETQGKVPTLNKADPRIRSVPFAVGKPTFEEVKEAYSKVTTILFEPLGMDVTNEEIPKKSPKMKAVIPKAIKEEEAKFLEEIPEEPKLEPCLPLQMLIDACNTGDISTASNAIESCSINEEDQWNPRLVINMPQDLNSLSTPLHIATQNGHAALVSWLLENGADPALRDIRGRVPFYLVQDKEVRDAFRKYRASAEELHNWEMTGIPPGLTEEQEKLKKEKEKEKRKKAKERKKERSAEQAIIQAEKAQQEEFERAQKIAEEARQLELSKCGGCGKAVLDKMPLHVFEQICCSSACIQIVKRRLAAEAAEKRFGGKYLH